MHLLRVKNDQLVAGKQKGFVINLNGDFSIETEQDFHCVMPVHRDVRAFESRHGNFQTKISQRMHGLVIYSFHCKNLLYSRLFYIKMSISL